MELAEHARRAARRARAFLAAKEPGHFLVNVKVPAEAPPMPPLTEIDPEKDLPRWLDGLIAAARPGWEGKAGIDDDAPPSLCPSFGIAEHSAWLGLEVRAQETTNLPTPALTSLDDLSPIGPRESNPWYRYMKSGYDYLRSRRDGSFLLSVRGAMAPMDLANAVRGDEIFVEFLTEPAAVHKLMRFLAEAEHWYYQRLRSWADEVEGGHFYHYGGIWIGPEAIGHISNDAAMLCRPEVYDEFGYPYEAELTGKYRWAFYHVHSEKLHFLPRLVQLPNLGLLEITPDPQAPPPVEDLPRIYASTGSANLMLHCTSDQVRAHIEELKGRNVALTVGCRDRAEAEDVLAFVRGHSRPLD